jgi:PAS domain S-box-containing protein
MKNPTTLKNFILFAVILITCVLGLAWHTYNAASEIRYSDRVVSQRQKTIIAAHDLVQEISKLISVQRGIVIHKEANQNEYEALKRELTNQVGLLSGLVKSNPAQASRMTEIEHLSLKLKDELDQKVLSYQNQYTIPSITEYDETVRMRESITQLARDVLNEEYRLLNAWQMRSSSLIYRYQLSLLIGAVVASIIILIFNWYLLEAENRISKTEATLRESEERLRLAIRGSNDGIFDWNFKTHQIYWSSQYKAMLGYEDEEIRGDEETFRKLIHPDDSEIFWEAFNGYINGKLSEFSSIFRMVHKGGRPVWIHGRGKAIFDENGQPIRFIGAHTDISYIKEHEKQLQEERDRAERASAAKGEFLAHMSHEIRTPLTAISGIAEIFSQKEDNFNDNQKKLVKTLRTSTESLKELITDILDFSRIESGEIEIHNQKFLLDDLFTQVVNIMAVKAAEKSLDFSFDYKSLKEASYYGDKQRFRQILINLIGNAVKFTEKGFVRVNARLENTADSRLLKIDISDSGIGISEAALPLIFEKFRQADASVNRRYGGTGLGLSISKSLVEIMGGTIKVQSDVGAGSTFTLILPFNEATGEEGNDIGEALRIENLNDRLKQAIPHAKRVLLVEDYEGNIVVLNYLLKSMNCEFDVARTGLEAVQLWKGRDYDLVLMDVQMPEMDGLTATRTIRRMEEEQGIMEPTPIIGLTAHALVADKQKCIDAGMNDYLSKPIIEADLKMAILKIFEKKQPGRGAQAAE